MARYDRSRWPPAPVASVTIEHPETGAKSSVLTGKLDSGADLAIIPRTAIVDPGLTPRGTLKMRVWEGSWRPTPYVLARLRVDGFQMPAILCLVADRDDVLVGRNVLNEFILTLDGKNLIVRMEDP